MDIKFNCPKCQQPLEGDSELRAELITCPHCQHEFFPIPQQPPAVNPVSPPQKRFRPAGLIALASFAILLIWWVHHQQHLEIYKSRDLGFVLPDDPAVASAFSEVQDKLVSPGTAKNVDSESAIVDGFAHVRLSIDSQTIYGGLVRSVWGVTLEQYHYETNFWWHATEVIQLSGPKAVRN